MNRFFSKIFYGLEYYLLRYKTLFIFHAAAMVAGVILGCILESKTQNFCMKTDAFLEVLIRGGFGSVFFKALFANLLLFAAAVALGLSSKIAWICFILTFLRGIALGALTFEIFAVLGFLGVLYFIFFALIQMAICVFAVAYAQAVCCDCCYNGVLNEYRQLLIFVALIFAVCLAQTIVFFVILRNLFIF